MPSNDKATLVGLSLEDPLASVRDPAFTALIEKGFTIGAHIPAQRGDRQEWMLLMVPPSLPHRQVTLSSQAKAAIWTIAVFQALLLTTIMYSIYRFGG
jgi:hypothetical protein